eukprot:jgi/Botrbrau1/7748/Bobra.0159s0177.1
MTPLRNCCIAELSALEFPEFSAIALLRSQRADFLRSQRLLPLRSQRLGVNLYSPARPGHLRSQRLGSTYIARRGRGKNLPLHVRMHMVGQVLSALSPENRAAIADCLAAETFEDGQMILKEGEPLTAESKFYLIESGSVECSKTFEGVKKVTTVLGSGAFFGEVALITHGSYRAADCVARGTTKVLTLGRDAFERLMGPAEEILEDKVDQYIKMNRRAGAVAEELAELDKDRTAPGLKRVRGYSLI